MFVELSPAEKKVNDLLRSLGPMERLEITADITGKGETFLVTRTEKGRLNGPILTPIK